MESSSASIVEPAQRKGMRASPRVAKVVELIGVSDRNWEDAAQVAVEEARKTIHGIRGIKIKEMTAKVDPDSGQIVEYRSCVNLSFGVMDEER
jgi:hypothetical protein